jgi:hypothetical protein
MPACRRAAQQRDEFHKADHRNAATSCSSPPKSVLSTLQLFTAPVPLQMIASALLPSQLRSTTYAAGEFVPNPRRLSSAAESRWEEYPADYGKMELGDKLRRPSKAQFNGYRRLANPHQNCVGYRPPAPYGTASAYFSSR